MNEWPIFCCFYINSTKKIHANLETGFGFPFHSLLPNQVWMVADRYHQVIFSLGPPRCQGSSNMVRTIFKWDSMYFGTFYFGTHKLYREDICFNVSIAFTQSFHVAYRLTLKCCWLSFSTCKIVVSNN